MRSVVNSTAQDVAHTMFTTDTSSLKDQKAYSISEVMLPQVWHMLTTALWPGQTLELVVQLCSALLPDLAAAHLHSLQLSGTSPMEVKFQILVHHTTELGVLILGQ